ncbi:MAG: sodium:solute symporter family protein [Lachnospiraceae bacterium]|jgi:SSS family solute:Na+ symporter|nr:sodium:solute symporter family protein [Lachnospiraceae bacterium]MCI1657592.1 sodium:solute symporter family protein [Lachnospiraceae bacterium]MCI2195994.1 sodium:solute symporter family protein [Lachnospiraceae bacterium]HAD20381.1 sodium:proline symporter [Lachnospiraceae bacterium]
MNWGVLIFVLLYEFATIFGVGFVIARKGRKMASEEGSFALAGKGLPTAQVGITLALTMLGSAHIWGTCENSATMGSIAVWFGIACTVMMVVITQITGPWVRKIGTDTIPDLFGRLYGKKVRILIACVMGPLVFGCLCLETQCVAVTFVVCTGWPYMVGALVGGAFGIFYVLLAGMKEVSWLNMINAVFMYGALIVALIAMFVCLPGQGWDDVAKNLQTSGNGWMLDIFGNKDIIIGFAIPTIFTCTMFQGVSQMGLQTCIAAKDTTSIKKSIWLAGPVNGMFCIIPTLLGLAALALGYLKVGGSAMMMTPAMMLAVLPKWVIALICASFLGALLSTFAMTSLCPATIFAYDLYGGLYRPDATEKQKTRVMRIMIVIVGIAAIVLCQFQPTVVTTINWIFTWAVPIFTTLIFGLCWKRNTKAMVITCVVSWIANVVWITCGLQTALHMPNFHQVYLCLIITLVVGFLTFGLMPGSQPGYFKLSRKEQEATAAMKATHEI